MASFNLGQVAIVNKGAWSASVSYAILNTVTHNNGSFMAIAPSSNVEPGVATDWESYWVTTAIGIKTVTVTAQGTTQAAVTVTFSDGSTASGGSFDTSDVADDSITTEKLTDGSVTAPKLASDILPANVGIKMGTATPTTSMISNGQIYLQYS